MLVLAVALTLVRRDTFKTREIAKTKDKKPQIDSVPADLIQQAIADEKGLILEGKSKADAAMAIFRMIGEGSQEAVVQAFFEGATLTPNGALT